MEIKVGDVFKNRYILKLIMLEPSKDFQPMFFLYDKKEDKVVNYNKEEMEKILDLKEC